MSAISENLGAVSHNALMRIAQLQVQPTGQQLSKNQPYILPEYLTPWQVEQLTGFSLRALEAMRAKRIGPCYLKIGKGKNGPIRYPLNDLREWLNKHKEATNG
jgi:hypothetical protein